MIVVTLDSKVLASIARQEVTFEGGNVSRERRIQLLEEEIEILNNSRKTEWMWMNHYVNTYLYKVDLVRNGFNVSSY